MLEDPVLKEVAKQIGRTVAQVAMRYLLQRGIVIVAKSFTPERIRQNFQVTRRVNHAEISDTKHYTTLQK